jgi:hypothetical protein
MFRMRVGVNNSCRSFGLLRTSPAGRNGLPVARWTVLALLLLASAALLVRMTWDPAAGFPPSSPIPVAEFSRLFREFSEPDGFFRSDNFISNETSYLHIVPLLKQQGLSGGAYLGVGPEQNFTYIAKIRPELAFILDIRRQAVLQHLVYKAIFQFSDSRRDFLALLLSRPPDDEEAPLADVPLRHLLAYFAARPPSLDFFQHNLSRILMFIQSDCQIPLSTADIRSIRYVLSAFRADGLDIRYRVGRGNEFGLMPSSYWGGLFPSLGELLAEEDLNGRMDGFLASDDDFKFIKGMHQRNRIIPVVGDFAGPQALKSIATYLDEKNIQVTVFYVSNVEQYLFQYNAFEHFADNVRTLPFAENSVFIRAVAGRRYQHPANIPGHRLTTILQKTRAFISAYDRGELRSYWELVTSDFMAAQLSSSSPRKALSNSH